MAKKKTTDQAAEEKKTVKKTASSRKTVKADAEPKASAASKKTASGKTRKKAAPETEAPAVPSASTAKSTPVRRRKKKTDDEQIMKEVAAELAQESAAAATKKKKKTKAAAKPEPVEEEKKTSSRKVRTTRASDPEAPARPRRLRRAAVEEAEAAVEVSLDPAAEKTTKRKKRKYRRRSTTAETPVITAKYQGKKILDSTMVPHLEAAKAPKLVGDVSYSKEELDYFRELIIEKINDATDELQSIEERLMDNTTGESGDEDSTYSLHMADQGTDAMEREKAFLFAARERKFISHLSDALQRIKSGNYGICITCGQLIDKGRLEAVPHARMCVNCKNQGKLP